MPSKDNAKFEWLCDLSFMRHPCMLLLDESSSCCSMSHPRDRCWKAASIVVIKGLRLWIWLFVQRRFFVHLKVLVDMNERSTLMQWPP